jgi:Zn-dependent protease
MNWLAVSLDEGAGIKLVVGLIAWFAQMGFHEGGHAWAAYKLGDPTAYYLGKRTVNPFAHVNWKDPFSVISAVVMPAVTSIYFMVPLGMAWVPVNPSNFRHPVRDHAIVAAAGPAGGFVVAIAFFLLYLALYPVVRGDDLSTAQFLLKYLLMLTYLTAIVYSVFNLLPVPPLDGSNILYYFGNEQLRNFLDRIRPFGFIILIVVFWILGGGRIINPVVEFLWWPFVHLPPQVWGS